MIERITIDPRELVRVLSLLEDGDLPEARELLRDLIGQD